MASLWALVRQQPLDRRYTVWRSESMRDANGSVPANKGAHFVSKGRTAVHRYRFRARAMSVALKAAWEVRKEKYFMQYQYHIREIMQTLHTD